jgi:hypothetical protein
MKECANNLYRALNFYDACYGIGSRTKDEQPEEYGYQSFGLIAGMRSFVS